VAATALERDQVPRARAGIDWKTLSLDAMDGFILSRVDGVSTVGEICLGSGLGEERTIAVLERLRARGLLELEGETNPPVPPRSPAAPPPAAPPPRVAAAERTTEPGPAGRPLERPTAPAPAGRLPERPATAPRASPTGGRAPTSATGGQRSPLVAPGAPPPPPPAPPRPPTHPPGSGLRADLPRADAPRDAAAATALADPPAAPAPAPAPAPASPPPPPRAPVPALAPPAPPSPPPRPAADAGVQALLRDYVDVPETTQAPALTPGAHEGSGVEFVEYQGVNLPVAELSEAVDLPEDQRKRILAMYYRLATMTYYDFFDIRPDADDKTVKKAFRDVSRLYHPDQFFRRELGSYRAKIEALNKFARRANEVLTDEDVRRDYDATHGFAAPAAAPAVRRAPSLTPPPAPAAGPPTELRDLTDDQKKRIDALYHRLGDIDYFTLLELNPGAGASDVKRAYFKLSKEFHPDRWRTKELGEYRERLVAVFKELSRGYKFLSDEKNRNEYVKALAEQRGGPITPLPSRVSRAAMEVAESRGASLSPADRAWAEATSTPSGRFPAVGGAERQPGGPPRSVTPSPSGTIPPAATAPGAPATTPPRTAPPPPRSPPASPVPAPPRPGSPAPAAPPLRTGPTPTPGGPPSGAVPAVARPSAASAPPVGPPPPKPARPAPLPTPPPQTTPPTRPPLRAPGAPTPPHAGAPATTPPTDPGRAIDARRESSVQAAVQLEDERKRKEERAARDRARLEERVRLGTAGRGVGAAASPLLQRSDRARRYVEAGKDDLANERYSRAANAFKLALSYDPDDEEVRSLYETAHTKSTRLAADGLVRRADMEVQVGDLKLAASLYDQAASVNPVPAIMHRAAVLMLAARENLHRAQDYANRAAQAEPQKADYRLTLAKVYIEAGLLKNAARELDAAKNLAETDEQKAEVKALKKRL